MLLLLHCSEVHGYELLEGLKRFGCDESPADSSTVYRILRGLEAKGYVTSRWDTAGRGPARRLYQITAQGDEHLTCWVADLRETDRVLHRFLRGYDSHMRLHH